MITANNEDDGYTPKPRDVGVAAVATCSLPVSSAEALIYSWNHAASTREDLALKCRTEGNIDDAIPLENAANAYRRCAGELRRKLVAATERQPEENADDERRA